MRPRYNFAPAAPEETLVYGAERPGFRTHSPDDDVEEWVAFMQSHGIERVCCLLESKLDTYDDLLGAYRGAFGDENVLHAPNEDHTPLTVDLFVGDVLPFLRAGAAADQRTVVHCSAGIGRTGQVLVGWLCCVRDSTPEDALETVENATDGFRAPLEARETDRDHLRALCAACE